MVQLSLASTTGNQGIRYFPFKGHLGLTPVEIEGVVRTKLDADFKTLPASSITISVRCYECRQGKVNTLESTVLVDYTQVLWSKPPAVQYADIGDTELPFRFNIPTQAAGFSMATFVEYRVFWKIEAYLNHINIPGVGVRHSKYSYLPLIRYDVPLYRPWSSASILDRETVRSRIPAMQYSIKTPPHAIGPSDLVSITISVQLPVTHAVILRSANLVIERRLQINLNDENELRVPQPRSPYSAGHSSETTLVNSDTRGNSPLSDSRPSVTPIATAESSGDFVKDATGVWNKTLTVQWPALRSNSRWAIGETMQSDMASIKFFARVKIAVSSTLGQESIDLGEQEMLVASTNESERQMAWTRYAERTGRNLRSKSKSPRRSQNRQSSAPLGLNAEAGPSRLPSHKVPRTGSSSRRPHTSAGPRDQSNNSSRDIMYEHPEPGMADRPPASAPVVSNQTQSLPQQSSSTATNNETAGMTVSHAVDTVQMTAWENELARIETESRRISVAAPWYAMKRKRIEPVAQCIS